MAALGGNFPETLLAQAMRLAQFYCARSTEFRKCEPVPGKIRWYELQFLHSSPDVLDLDLTLSALREVLPGAFSQSTNKPPNKRGIRRCPRLSMPRSSLSVPAPPVTPRRSMRRARCSNRC